MHNANKPPNIWLACLLVLFLQPFGHWYIGRLKWAAFYFILSLVVAAGDYWLDVQGFSIGKYHILKLGFALISVLHIVYLIKFTTIKCRRKWYSRWYGVLLALVSFAFIVFGFRAFIYEPFAIPSLSMSPSLKIGDQIIVSKWGYGNYGTFGLSVFKSTPSKSINKGDMIVFEYPKDPKISFVKRVIGSAGDVIIITAKHMTVNDQQVSHTFLRDVNKGKIYSETLNNQKYSIQVDEWRTKVQGRWQVPENSYFVMGDNRDNSNDSRYWGYVKNSAVIGKVEWIISVDQ